MRKRTKPKIHKDEYFASSNPPPIMGGGDGRVKKTWKLGDLKFVKPITHAQTEMFESYFDGAQLILTGSAGTGKTYGATFLAMRSVLSLTEPQDKLIIVRSAVASRDQGFLPGTLQEKESVLALPYVDILGDLFGKSDTFKRMQESGLVSFMTTSYVRGITLSDSVIIIDEAQNMTIKEINSIMTRVGKNSRVIFCGDTRQGDLSKKGEVEGLSKLIQVAGHMDEFEIVTFLPEDVVRSGLCKSWILALESVGW